MFHPHSMGLGRTDAIFWCGRWRFNMRWTNMMCAASGSAAYAAKHFITFLLALRSNKRFIHAAGQTALHYVASRHENGEKLLSSLSPTATRVIGSFSINTRSQEKKKQKTKAGILINDALSKQQTCQDPGGRLPAPHTRQHPPPVANKCENKHIVN